MAWVPIEKLWARSGQEMGKKRARTGRHWIGGKGGAIEGESKTIARFHIFLKLPITRKLFCM
jgi:hypothetical protein